MNISEFIKIKIFCSSKDTIKKLKASQRVRKYKTYSLEPVSKIYKELLQLNSKKKIQFKNR